MWGTIVLITGNQGGWAKLLDTYLNYNLIFIYETQAGDAKQMIHIQFTFGSRDALAGVLPWLPGWACMCVYGGRVRCNACPSKV